MCKEHRTANQENPFCQFGQIILHVGASGLLWGSGLMFLVRKMGPGYLQLWGVVKVQ